MVRGSPGERKAPLDTRNEPGDSRLADPEARAAREGPGPESGHALILALVVVVLTSAALALVAASLQLQMESLRRQVIEVNLAALSDAALAEALARLAQGPASSRIPERRFGGGFLSSHIEPLGGNEVRVVATASFAGKRRVVEAEVRRTAQGPVVLRWRRRGSSPAPPPRTVDRVPEW